MLRFPALMVNVWFIDCCDMGPGARGRLGSLHSWHSITVHLAAQRFLRLRLPLDAIQLDRPRLPLTKPPLEQVGTAAVLLFAMQPQRNNGCLAYKAGTATTLSCCPTTSLYIYSATWARARHVL